MGSAYHCENKFLWNIHQLIKLIPKLQPSQHEHYLEYNLVSDPHILCLVRVILSFTVVTVLMC